MGPVRFIHAADTHLGTPFKGSGAKDPALQEALVEAGYTSFRRLVEHAISEEVDFVVIAGDVYDAQSFSGRATAALLRGARRLGDAGIALYLLHGNHDPLSAGRGLASMPDNVFSFPAGEVGWFDHQCASGTVCRLYGRSFASSSENENFAQGYRRHADVECAIGVLHTMLGDRPGHSPYAPSSESDLRRAAMDYWALGHVHLAEVVSSGSPCIVYPGSTQACTEAETGPHGCYLATIEHGITTLKWLATGTVNPRRIEVDLSGANTVEEARSAVLSAVDEAIDGEAASSIMRIALTGTRRFADSFGADSARELIALVRESVADHIPPVWVNSSIADSSRRYYGEDLSRSSNAFVTSMVEVAAKLDIETTIRSSKAVAELPAHERNAILSQLMQEPDRLREMALEAAYHQVMEGKVGR